MFISVMILSISALMYIRPVAASYLTIALAHSTTPSSSVGNPIIGQYYSYDHPSLSK